MSVQNIRFSKKAVLKLPIVSSSMKEEEIRELAVSYAALQASVVWTPEREMRFFCPGASGADENGCILYEKGKRYRGVPYGRAGTDLLTFLDDYHEKSGKLSAKKELGGTGSDLMFWAWSRVSASLTASSARYMLPENGYLKLGSYSVPPELSDFDELSTKKICSRNGKQTMLESYALLKKADGIVLYKPGVGYPEMVMEDAAVTRNEEGAILEEDSFVYTVTQHSVFNEVEEDGQTICEIGGVREKKTFSSLFKSGYLPFRIPEIAALAPVQKGKAVFVAPKGETDLVDLQLATVRSNYPIAFVEASIEGEKKYSAAGKAGAESRIFELFDLHLPDEFEGGETKKRVVIRARLSNGETVTAFDGDVVRPAAIGKLKKRVTKKDLDAIPVLKRGMTEEEMRKICTDYTFLQASIPWTPTETIQYACGTAGAADGNGNLSFHRGRTYGGVPYTHAGRDLYNFMSFLDDRTGTVDTSSFGMGFGTLLGNNCASAMFWGWGRISSSVTYTYTGNMVPKNGCFKLGPYRYDTQIDDFLEYGTRRICEENGEQTMFESYALMKPGDGFVLSNNGAGHASMCYRAPEVVRKEDGTIDGEKSTIRIVEQHSNFTLLETENGTVSNVGGAPTTHTFNKLFKLSDIPFRIPEFCGIPVEKPVFCFELKEKAKLDLDDLENAHLTCNYPISQVWLEATDRNGKKTVLTGFGRVRTARDFALSELGITPLLPAGDLKISARVSTGEIQTVYEGKIVR